MSYDFSGIIINNPTIKTIDILNVNKIKYSFHSIPSELIMISSVSLILEKYLEFDIGDKVLYLEYDTWAGSIDMCRGYYIDNGGIIGGSQIEGEYPNCEKVFIELFNGINIQIGSDCYFDPFDRREK